MFGVLTRKESFELYLMLSDAGHRNYLLFDTVALFCGDADNQFGYSQNESYELATELYNEFNGWKA